MINWELLGPRNFTVIAVIAIVTMYFFNKFSGGK